MELAEKKVATFWFWCEYFLITHGTLTMSETAKILGW